MVGLTRNILSTVVAAQLSRGGPPLNAFVRSFLLDSFALQSKSSNAVIIQTVSTLFQWVRVLFTRRDTRVAMYQTAISNHTLSITLYPSCVPFGLSLRHFLIRQLWKLCPWISKFSGRGYVSREIAIDLALLFKVNTVHELYRWYSILLALCPSLLRPSVPPSALFIHFTRTTDHSYSINRYP